jgi:hypothetical protein
MYPPSARVRLAQMVQCHGFQTIAIYILLKIIDTHTVQLENLFFYISRTSMRWKLHRFTSVFELYTYNNKHIQISTPKLKHNLSGLRVYDSTALHFLKDSEGQNFHCCSRFKRTVLFNSFGDSPSFPRLRTEHQRVASVSLNSIDISDHIELCKGLYNGHHVCLSTCLSAS